MIPLVGAVAKDSSAFMSLWDFFFFFALMLWAVEGGFGNPTTVTCQICSRIMTTAELASIPGLSAISIVWD
jgi:hypothetical protein